MKSAFDQWVDAPEAYAEAGADKLDKVKDIILSLAERFTRKPEPYVPLDNGKGWQTPYYTWRDDEYSEGQRMEGPDEKEAYLLGRMGKLPDYWHQPEHPNWQARTLGPGTHWSDNPYWTGLPSSGAITDLDRVLMVLQGQDDRIRFPWGADARPQQVLDTAQMGAGWESSNDPMFLDVLRTLGAQKMMDRRGR